MDQPADVVVQELFVGMGDENSHLIGILCVRMREIIGNIGKAEVELIEEMLAAKPVLLRVLTDIIANQLSHPLAICSIRVEACFRLLWVYSTSNVRDKMRINWHTLTKRWILVRPGSALRTSVVVRQSSSISLGAATVMSASCNARGRPRKAELKRCSMKIHQNILRRISVSRGLPLVW